MTRHDLISRALAFAMMACYQVFRSILLLFVVVIPLLYMLGMLMHSQNMYADALATITATLIRDGSQPMMTADGNVPSTYWGLIVGITMLTLLPLVFDLLLEMTPSKRPRKERLFERLDRIPRRQRELACLELYDYLEQMIPSGPKR